MTQIVPIRRKTMNEETVNVAEAKKHFSELLGRVAFGKKHILITKRGKPMARLIPADNPDTHLGNAKGWLKDDDPFFDAIEQIIQDRTTHEPRVFKGNFTE
jgi:prevent-host-death family protein